jgi:SAM-dependent methyltransferase
MSFKNIIRQNFQYLPSQIREPITLIRNLVRSLPYQGTGRSCPVCGKSSRKFGDFGTPPRKDAQCMFCGALERHRYVWLYLNQHTNLFDGKPKKMLHVAPEQCFEARLRKLLGRNYITADLFDARAMVRMDITEIKYPNNSFDVIYCSHVFEHVIDDRKAMREFHRVLKPDGWAILLVPITAESTFEDPSVTEASERLRLFGQIDHVRKYGADYIDRLRTSGFTVRVDYATDFFQQPEIEKFGLTNASGGIYYCTK